MASAIDMSFTIIVPAQVPKEEALKRRQLYLRPFILYTVNSYLAESVSHPWWFHIRYPIIFLAGIPAANKLFTDDGQKELATKWGI